MDQGELQNLAPEIEARWIEIRSKILDAAPHLITQGTLVAKPLLKGPCWRLRYVERLPDGQSVHRAIGIGSDPELRRRTEELLDRCRQRGHRGDEIKALHDMSQTLAGIARTVGSRRRPQFRSRLGR